MSGTAVRHPVFARCYTGVSEVLERLGLAERRRELLAGLSGRVIEVGAGNGLNFAHYPPAVTGVLAVEPEPELRRRATRAARRAPVPVEVVAGLADRLPARDRSFDAAVASLVLCSLPDPVAGLREVRRVLVPGERLRFLEHVRADSPAWPASSACWTRRSGPGWRAAATPAGTAPRPSGRPGSPSPRWTGSSSPGSPPRSPSSFSVRPRPRPPADLRPDRHRSGPVPPRSARAPIASGPFRRPVPARDLAVPGCRHPGLAGPSRSPYRARHDRRWALGPHPRRAGHRVR
ncbi:class I SAM-dependent methyltransferase [Streptosporangium sandarakinum]|uniref:class I SAM-dependent methyltransferase n=1 Tax=Streptosporangium sandarakinum TaxID=1260955 RepID=UPI003D91976C